MATERRSPHAARTSVVRGPELRLAPGWVRSREQGWVYSGERRRASEEHMRGCGDCLENRRILHAMGETYAAVVSVPGWANGLLAQSAEEEARRREGAP
jgi:hypothetical protein